MAKILVTGGAGFIGSNFIRYWVQSYPQDSIVNLDSLSYSGNQGIVKEFKKYPKVKCVRGNVCDRALVHSLLKGQDAVFHFAAETHVDRSILDSEIFLRTNVLGTHNLLEGVRKNGVKRLIVISTDEVYGSIEKGTFNEKSPLEPRSPYAVSKAAADMLCQAYWTTYRTPVILTRCCNNFGPYQFPEKVIPLFITNLIQGKDIPVYGKGLNVREWIHVLDHCRALRSVYQKGALGEVYNIGTGLKIPNIQLAKLILNFMKEPLSKIQFVKDRPGHDFRYALKSSKVRKLGWSPQFTLQSALAKTVEWYRENKPWWTSIKQEARFKKYIKRQYA